MANRNDKGGLPLEDRQDLCRYDLFKRMPAIQRRYDLRDDQLAEVLNDLRSWYADDEVNLAEASPRTNGTKRKGGAA